MATQTVDAFAILITGSDQPISEPVTIASGENVAANTPLGQVSATGKFVAWDPAANDGSQIATRMTVYAVDASSADTVASAYKTGTFNPELVAWPDGTTAVQKLTIFNGTPISLQAPRN